MKKLLAITLAGLMALSVSACGRVPDDGDEPTDESKTQLIVGVFDGGYKRNWMDNMADEFELLNENTEFEAGKKGIQIKVESNREYIGDDFGSAIVDREEHIMFTESTSYYNFVKKGEANGNVENITTWVTTPLTEYGETESIVDKLDEKDKEYFGQGTAQKYYGLPSINMHQSINYDIALFEENNWYFAPDGNFIASPDDPRSYGPDGKTGIVNGIDYSVDDGCPATYDQFFQLCDKIVADGMIPFIWSGACPGYVSELLDVLAADASGFDNTGKANFQRCFDFNGTASNIIDTINELDGTFTYKDPVAINNLNGYLTREQDGFYYALQFMERLLTTRNEDGSYKYFMEEDGLGSISHLGAQTKFLKSSTNGTPIAMFIDGTWWYNEARDTFVSMEGTPGMGMSERKLGVMPIPKPTPEKVGEAPIKVTSYFTHVVVRGNIEDALMPAVKAFFRFIHTDHCLSVFLRDANGVRPYDFEIEEAHKPFVSPYAMETYNELKSTTFVHPYSTNSIMVNFGSSIHQNHNTIVPGGSYEHMTEAMAENGVTAIEYFNGMKTYWGGESGWRAYSQGGVN